MLNGILQIAGENSEMFILLGFIFSIIGGRGLGKAIAEVNYGDELNVNKVRINAYKERYGVLNYEGVSWNEPLKF